MARGNRYNADPLLEPVPLSVEEAAELADDPRLIGRKDIPHLLRRILATTWQTRNLRQRYDEELRRRTEAMPRPGLLPTLSPEQAAKFLSPDQLTRLFDTFKQERLEDLELMRRRAHEDHARLQECLDEAADVIVHALNEPGLPPTAAERLRLVLHRLRTGVTGDDGKGTGA